jgi:hypothetical protein
MDPNEVLRLMRSSAKRIHAMLLLDDNEAVTLADAVEAMDDWLRKGGFLPDDWDPEINQAFGDCK